MNILLYSSSPQECARALDDARLRKLQVETAQMLSTAVHASGIDKWRHLVMKPAYPHHPVTKFVSSSVEAFCWTEILFREMVDESVYRFGKSFIGSIELQKVFKSARCALLYGGAVSGFEGKGLNFVNCARNKELGLDFTDLPVHDAYRLYSNMRWLLDKKPPVWTGREAPYWAWGHRLRQDWGSQSCATGKGLEGQELST